MTTQLQRPFFFGTIGKASVPFSHMLGAMQKQTPPVAYKVISTPLKK